MNLSRIFGFAQESGMHLEHICCTLHVMLLKQKKVHCLPHLLHFKCLPMKQKLFLLIIFNSSIFHHPKLNCKANFHTKYQIKLQAVTNHMIYIKPYMTKALEIRTIPNMANCVTESSHTWSHISSSCLFIPFRYFLTIF